MAESRYSCISWSDAQRASLFQLALRSGGQESTSWCSSMNIAVNFVAHCLFNVLQNGSIFSLVGITVNRKCSLAELLATDVFNLNEEDLNVLGNVPYPILDCLKTVPLRKLTLLVQ